MEDSLLGAVESDAHDWSVVVTQQKHIPTYAHTHTFHKLMCCLYLFPPSPQCGKEHCSMAVSSAASYLRGLGIKCWYREQLL